MAVRSVQSDRGTSLSSLATRDRGQAPGVEIAKELIGRVERGVQAIHRVSRSDADDSRHEKSSDQDPRQMQRRERRHRRGLRNRHVDNPLAVQGVRNSSFLAFADVQDVVVFRGLYIASQVSLLRPLGVESPRYSLI